MRIVDLHHSEAIAEEDLSPRLAACPLCRDASREALFAVQDEPTVTLMRCNRCRCAYVDRVPREAVLTDYYSRYYQSTPDSAVATDDYRIISRRISRISKIWASPLHVLDFGGGDGSVARDVVSRVAGTGRVVVVDHGEKICASIDAIPITKQASLYDLDADQGGFDLVIASAVLEHLRDPMPVLRQLIDLLQVGGILYVRTPDVAPVVGLARRLRLPVDFGFPAHLFDLGQPFWSRIQTWNDATGKVEVLSSRPSPVETTLKHHPARTVVATAVKSPWHVIGSSWRFVGGWEWIARRVPG